MGRITHLLPSTFKHKRKTRASNMRGGFAEVYEEIGTVKGRIQPAKWMAIQIARQVNAQVTHQIYLEPDTEIEVNDEFELEGRRLRVIVPAIVPSVPIYKMAVGEEIQK